MARRAVEFIHAVLAHVRNRTEANVNSGRIEMERMLCLSVTKE
jgi:hypothetical protein